MHAHQAHYTPHDDVVCIHRATLWIIKVIGILEMWSVLVLAQHAPTHTFNNPGFETFDRSKTMWNLRLFPFCLSDTVYFPQYQHLYGSTAVILCNKVLNIFSWFIQYEICFNIYIYIGSLPCLHFVMSQNHQIIEIAIQFYWPKKLLKKQNKNVIVHVGEAFPFQLPPMMLVLLLLPLPSLLSQPQSHTAATTAMLPSLLGGSHHCCRMWVPPASCTVTLSSFINHF